MYIVGRKKVVAQWRPQFSVRREENPDLREDECKALCAAASVPRT